jgi:hypothetical protein
MYIDGYCQLGYSTSELGPIPENSLIIKIPINNTKKLQIKAVKRKCRKRRRELGRKGNVKIK